MSTNQSYTTERRQAAAYADKVCAEFSEKKWNEVFNRELARKIDLSKARAARVKAGDFKKRGNHKYSGECGSDYVARRADFYHPNFGNL